MAPLKKEGLRSGWSTTAPPSQNCARTLGPCWAGSRRSTSMNAAPGSGRGRGRGNCSQHASPGAWQRGGACHPRTLRRLCARIYAEPADEVGYTWFRRRGPM